MSRPAAEHSLVSVFVPEGLQCNWPSCNEDTCSESCMSQTDSQRDLPMIFELVLMVHQLW